MENNKKEDLVFVSFDRIWDNFKKYWWICAVLTVAMLVYGAATYNRTIALNDLSDTETEVVSIPDDETKRLYVSTMPINYVVSVDEFMESSGVSVETGSSASWEMYTQLCNNVVAYANSIISSDAFYSAINQVYEANGYTTLSTSPTYAGDTEYDQFSVTYLSDKTFLLTYTGIGGMDRINAGTTAAANALAAELENMCDYVTCDVYSQATLQLRIFLFGTTFDFAPTAEAIANVEAQYSEHNQIATGEIPMFDFSAAALVKTSTLIKGAVGFIIGLFIIFVLAICDKKVRTREELEKYFEGEGTFIGEMKKSAAISMDVTAASITSMCEKHGIGRIILTTVGKQKQAKQLADLSIKISNDNVKAECADGIEVSAETTTAMAGAEGIIVVINSGFDDVHTIKNALSRINTVDGKLLGYVLSK